MIQALKKLIFIVLLTTYCSTALGWTVTCSRDEFTKVEICFIEAQSLEGVYKVHMLSLPQVDSLVLTFMGEQGLYADQLLVRVDDSDIIDLSDSGVLQGQRGVVIAALESNGKKDLIDSMRSGSKIMFRATERSGRQHTSSYSLDGFDDVWDELAGKIN